MVLLAFHQPDPLSEMGLGGQLGRNMIPVLVQALQTVVLVLAQCWGVIQHFRVGHVQVADHFLAGAMTEKGHLFDHTIKHH